MIGGIGEFSIGVDAIGASSQAPMNLYPSSAPFPPSGPASMLTSIPSFLYQEYSDDDDLQAFVAAYNGIAQGYIDWFNQINLPIYTGLSGPLLDWVGKGIYGIERPTLYSSVAYLLGELNTYGLNALGFNEGGIVNNISNITVTNDDIYQRVLTWHFYKGDGKQASAQWFRRRAVRFLYGANGGDFLSPVENVSVLVGGGEITITVVTSLVKMAAQSVLNSFTFNSMCLNQGATTTIATFTAPSVATMFAEAINTGALQMPAEYIATCRIGALGVRQ